MSISLSIHEWSSDREDQTDQKIPNAIKYFICDYTQIGNGGPQRRQWPTTRAHQVSFQSTWRWCGEGSECACRRVGAEAANGHPGFGRCRLRYSGWLLIWSVLNVIFAWLHSCCHLCLVVFVLSFLTSWKDKWFPNNIAGENDKIW